MFGEANEYHIKYDGLKDSLLNDENNKQIGEMNTKYESEKKDKELAAKDADILRSEMESGKRSLERNSFVVGFLLMSFLAFFIFRSFKQKQKLNIAITLQKEIVEDKQKEILDSIHYAKRIQRSLLPSEKYLKFHMERLRTKSRI